MSFLDFFFPPLCLVCRERTQLPFFCAVCWGLCAPIDPVGRCELCFAETEVDRCWTCQRRPHHVPFFRGAVFEPTPPVQRLCQERGNALAAFVFYQWVQLDWEVPDVIVPMPTATALAKEFACFFGISAVYCELLFWEEKKWQCKADLIEEHQTLLLLDEQSSLATLRSASWALAEAFPKRIFQLSLVAHDCSAFS